MYDEKIRKIAEDIKALSARTSRGGDADDNADEIRRLTYMVRDYGGAMLKVTKERYGISDDALLEIVSHFAKTACVLAGANASARGQDELEDQLLSNEYSEAFHYVASVSIVLGMGMVDELIFGPAQVGNGEQQ